MGLLLVLSAGCTRPNPSQAFDQLALAAESGDEAAFLDGLTLDSAVLVKMLLHLPTRRPEAMALGFGDRARASTHHIQADGQLAVLAVQTESGEQAQVFMRFEGGAWKLDLLSTELLWNRKWDLSGGRPRGFPDWFESDLSLPGTLDN